MTLRSQAYALIGRFIADIDSIIRKHAEHAAALALVERGLTRGRRPKRLGRTAPLKLIPPEPETPPKRAKKQPSPKARATAKHKAGKTRRKTRAEQLTLF